jgi:hypothetical protein
MGDAPDTRTPDLRVLSRTDGYLYLYGEESPEDYRKDVRRAHREAGLNVDECELTFRTANAPKLRRGGRRVGYNFTPKAPKLDGKLQPV